MLVLEDVENTDDVLAFTRRLRNRVVYTVMDGIEPVTVTLSVGVALFPVENWEMSQLLKRADMALYCAKRTSPEGICIEAPESFSVL